MSDPLHIVILTGAGISAESGIETFRSEGGLWEQYPIEQVATPEGFAADPALVHHFYNMRRAALKVVEPNAAHLALAELQTGLEARGGSLTIITQNVDDLHSQAGARGVIHMHGILTSLFCSACDHRFDWVDDVAHDMPCPACQTTGGPNKSVVRPDIVWFGEMPYEMDVIEARLRACDMFVSIGTSGAVYPAAGLVQMAGQLGKQTLELNLEKSQGSHFFDESRLGEAGTIVPKWVTEVLG
ncbi:NAD-dependent deacylase [Litorimonas sp. RW-G-Af-16]|uniref:NAD-dependent deacylase n=1 Tax=Litorimonas sp. RW-G-Af-16 TaxID=3241168 RepID=UPI00390CB024